ncbi:hypothetical protein H633G_11475 [Metarhizium anisopliae BRIP 53284]|nr:hypothetical protein H633G_11475 [Metarhizium anisopliae BRIP 53284]
MDFLEWCDQHKIIIAVFPPHSTHRLQPLDVSLFSPLSTAYSNQLIQLTAKTQGLISLSKREFWTLFWHAFQTSFSAENIASGWKRTGLLPFDPNVILSQITDKDEDNSDTGEDSAESLALQQPSARDLRRLVDKVIDESATNRDHNSRKLKSTLESLQSEVELLRYENQGLRETISYEKKRRQRGKALKDLLFDRTDPNSAQVFSPAKVAQAREARQQEKEANRQIRGDLKCQDLEMAHRMQDEGQTALDGREKTWKAPDPPSQNAKRKATAIPNCTARPKKPSLAVENDREMVAAFWDSGRPQRNSKRPRWFEDYEIE